jgi:hypothetical protein
VIVLNEPGERYAMLVVAALDCLWNDYERDEERCCPYHGCCAPCTVLRQLRDEGHLDALIQAAPEPMWSQSAWWRDAQVDRVWLESRWLPFGTCPSGKADNGASA